MASPQKENGYTAIANEIMDALCHIRIPGEERQVLDCILRKTYGWNKCEDAISLTQFVEMTGINKPCVIRAIQGLLSKKIISVIEKDNDRTKVYKFIKDYNSWKPLSKKITLSKKIINVIEKDNQSLSKKIPTKDTTTKTNKTNTVFVLPSYIPEETWQAYMAVRIKKKAAQTPYAFKLIIKELEKIKSTYGHDPVDVLNKSIKSGWADVYPLKENGNRNNQYLDSNDKYTFLDGIE